MGIEPTTYAWEAQVLPLNYARPIPEGWTILTPEGVSIIAPTGTDYKACLATGHHTEVCALSRQGMFHPLSDPLQIGIRFFRDPLPAEVSESLAEFLVWVLQHLIGIAEAIYLLDSIFSVRSHCRKTGQAPQSI